MHLNDDFYRSPIGLASASYPSFAKEAKSQETQLLLKNFIFSVVSSVMSRYSFIGARKRSGAEAGMSCVSPSHPNPAPNVPQPLRSPLYTKIPDSKP